MKYMGSKSRIKKQVLPILQGIIDDNNITTYIEPFVGGANVIDGIKCENKLAYDNHEHLIELFKKVQEDESCLPMEVSKEHYGDVRECFNQNGEKYPKWYVGAVGFLASYNGRWFDGGYSGKRIVGTGKERDYFAEAKRNLESQIPDLSNIEFSHSDFKELEIPKGSLVYCDIPYENTKKYSTSKGFDYSEFWSWAREIAKDNIVIVSEQDCPVEEVDILWEQEVKRTIDNNKRVKATEKLFKVR